MPMGIRQDMVHAAGIQPQLHPVLSPLSLSLGARKLKQCDIHKQQLEAMSPFVRGHLAGGKLKI